MYAFRAAKEDFMTETELNLPPLPPLKWNGYFWTGIFRLESWSNFQDRSGWYNSEASPGKKSDGTVKLYIAAPGPDLTEPCKEQIETFNYLLANQKVIQQQLLNAIFEKYPEERNLFREGYGYDEEMSEEEKEEFEEEYGQDAPELSSPDELKRVMGLSIVHILNCAKDGLAYVGYEFGCTWEDEHGCGAITHEKRVIEIGHADTSFNPPVNEEGIRVLKNK